MYQVLTDFANDHTLAEDIDVRVISGHVSMKARYPEGAKYEDSVLLSNLILGAKHFLMWARRKKIVRFKRDTRKRKKVA